MNGRSVRILLLERQVTLGHAGELTTGPMVLSPLPLFFLADKCEDKPIRINFRYQRNTLDNRKLREHQKTANIPCMP